MSELDQLIAEQKREMRRGARLPHESTISLEGWTRSLSNEGLTERAASRLGREWECPVHSTEDIVPAQKSWVERLGRKWRCRVCSRERRRLYYISHRAEAIAYNVEYQRRRYATDPAFRAKRAEANRRQRARRAAEVAA